MKMHGLKKELPVEQRGDGKIYFVAEYSQNVIGCFFVAKW